MVEKRLTIEDGFEQRVHPYWVRFATGHADLEWKQHSLKFVVDGAKEGLLSDAEIDDHRAIPRAKLPWKPPLRLLVQARMSHPADKVLGTAGFGFWNDPFDWSGNVDVPPNALWFFFASPKSDMAFARGVRGNGWKAASLNGGKAGKLTMFFGNLLFNLPGMSKLVFRLAQTQLRADECLLDDVATTDWHTYRIDWKRNEATFFVDEHQVLSTSFPTNVPLGFVAWMDNNYAVMGPGRVFAFGRMEVTGKQWLEIRHIRIERLE